MAESTTTTGQSGKPRQLKSIRAEAEFRAHVARLGGTVLEPEWLGSAKAHRALCPEGHECRPRPNDLQRGRGMCRTCAGNDPAVAQAAFRARVAALGGEVLEAEWRGILKPHKIRCRYGHISYPYPGRVASGVGICRVCGGNDPGAAWEAFKSRVAELGGRVLEPKWLGSNTPHGIQCAAGHRGMRRPTHIQEGRGLCNVCSGRDARTAEEAFRAIVAEQGGKVLGEWVNNRTPIKLICAAGHLCEPRPSNVSGRDGNICRTCAGRDSEAAWAAFRAEVERRGGAVLESAWLGANTPHRVRCKEGHEVAPWPVSVLRGTGICRLCAGKDWDVFYVVHDDVNDLIKFGITSGDARPRLATHARDGFDRILRLCDEMPQGVALTLERTILAALRDAKEEPVRGREYFPARVLPLVLDLVDNHPAARE